MKTLLIGKKSQLGQEINKIFQSSKHEIFAFGSHDLNILNHEQVKQKVKKIRPDVVINTAAYHVMANCELYPEKAFAINASAQKNLADACQETNSTLVYYSTDRVFDGEKRRVYKESDATRPVQVYGVSKLAGEQVSLNYNKNSIVIRACGMFGGVYGSREKKGNFVLYILKEAEEKNELEVASDQTVSFVAAEDLALATYELLKKGVKSGVFNIVNEGYASWANFAKEIVRLRKLKLKIKPVSRRGSYGDVPIPEFTALSTSKIRSYGITLPHWKKALKRYLDYLEANGV